MEFNTQYNTIFLLIKSSLFQYSVIFSDICGRNAVIFSDIRRDIQWYSVTSVEGMFVCVFCRCLFRLVFMFIFVYVYVCFYVLFLSLCLGLLFNGHWFHDCFFCLCLRLSLCVHRHRFQDCYSTCLVFVYTQFKVQCVCLHLCHWLLFLSSSLSLSFVFVIVSVIRRSRSDVESQWVSDV